MLGQLRRDDVARQGTGRGQGSGLVESRLAPAEKKPVFRKKKQMGQ